MRDAIILGAFGTIWCWPIFKLLYWLEDVKLVMIYPLETAIILALWMIPGWIIYDRLKKIGRVFRWPWER